MSNIDKLIEERGSNYGSFTDNAQRIMAMYNILTNNREAGQKGYPAFMIITKLVREFNKHKSDNLEDIQGYAKLWNEMEEQC